MYMCIFAFHNITQNKIFHSEVESLHIHNYFIYTPNTTREGSLLNQSKVKLHDMYIQNRYIFM